jgi:glycosyltransferase involved in cell wall biosynthesis
MKLAVLAAADPLDMSTWSGTPYFMTKALQRVYPDLLPVKHARPKWQLLMRRGIKRFTAGRIDIFWSKGLSSISARSICRHLQDQSADVVFCIGNAPLSAYIGKSMRTIHVSDATVPLMRNYYAEFYKLQRSLLNNAHELDRLSVLRSRAALFSTEWAARSAVDDYGAVSDGVHMIPWGANIVTNDLHLECSTVPDDVCHLVFIGVDWERKGGALAVATAMRLLAAGRPVQLHIIGATPALPQVHDKITVHGFINKATPEGREKFTRIMRQAAFLFVPTRQDCSPMVFPEANSYCVPVISTRTGGVADVVHEGVNGRLLSFEATADEYADLIWKVWSDQPRYRQLRKTSRHRFDRALNWDSWLKAVVPVIENAAKGE